MTRRYPDERGTRGPVRVAALIATLLATAWAATPTAAPAALAFAPERALVYAGADPAGVETSQTMKVRVDDDGTGTSWWLAIGTAPWLRASPVLGRAGSEVTFEVDASGLLPGRHEAFLVFFDLANFRLVGTLPVTAKVCEGVCVSVNVDDVRHPVSPLIFGTQAEWLDAGGGVWDNAVTASCDDPAIGAGAPRQSLLDELLPAGLRMLRYPGGIPSDFFHWAEAVGPVAQRIPQVDPWSSKPDAIVRQCPVFGPDEAVELATALATPLFITTNTAQGTADEAAAWLSHYRDAAVPAQYWEIGNENYIPGIPKGNPDGFPFYFARAYLPPAEYAGRVDEFARALRAVDPDVKVGFIAGRGFTDWNRSVFRAVTEPADFLTVHLFDPATCAFADAETVFKAMLAAPEVMTGNLAEIKDDAARFAAPANRALDLAVTEHGTLFFDCFGTLPPLVQRRNRTLASALYSALAYHVFMSDPRIKIAHHVRLVHPQHQAHLTTSVLDGVSNPVRSAFYRIFSLYATAAGGTALGGATQGAPTFSTTAYGATPALQGLPALHAFAARTADGSEVRLYVVNRSLDTDVTARVSLDGLADVQSVSAAVVNGASYNSVNTTFSPDAVSVQTAPIAPTTEFDYTFPAHSLVVFAVR